MSRENISDYEERPQHTDTWHRPFLQIPLPPPEYYERLSEEQREKEEENEEGRRVIVIDL